MKKFKKIICLALAMVMTMAMSVTAFAEETKQVADGTATIKVTNLEEGITVDVYKLATVYADGSIEVEDWAKDAYKKTKVDDIVSLTQDKMTDDAVKALQKAFAADKATKVNTEPLTVTGNEISLSVGLGAYYIVANGSKYTYLPMVAVTYSVKDNGEYNAADAIIVAKGDTNDLDKTASDEFVNAGESVDFEIKKTIPSNVTSFVIYDTTTNLSDLSEATVTVKVGEGESAEEVKNGDVNFAFKAVENKTNTFELDLTSLVDKFNNQKVSVTYTLTVIGDEGYVNTAYYHIPNFDSTPDEVKGYTGKFTLVKKNTEGEVLDGATFIAYTTKKNEDGKEYTAYVQADNDGKFTAYTENKDIATEFVTDANGEIVVTGLEDATYHFEETVAPKGYSVNTEGVDVTVSADATKLVEGTQIYAFSDELIDSNLVKLPFTGGMGTTIFTVLGVVIMAAAAALYFATKKNAAK